MSKIDDGQVGGDHYKKYAITPWDALEVWLPYEAFCGYLQGDALVYLSRYRNKNGLEDLKKARHYLDKLIAVVEAHVGDLSIRGFVEYEADRRIDQIIQGLRDAYGQSDAGKALQALIAERDELRAANQKQQGHVPPRPLPERPAP